MAGVRATAVKVVGLRDGFAAESGHSMSIMCDFSGWRGSFAKAVVSTLADMLDDGCAEDIVIYYVSGAKTMRIAGDVVYVTADSMITFAGGYNVHTDDIISIHF